MEEAERKINKLRMGGEDGMKFLNQNLNETSSWKVLLIVLVFIIAPIFLIWKYLFGEKVSA